MKDQIKQLTKEQWPVFLHTLLEVICNDARGEVSLNKWITSQFVPYDEDFGYSGLFLLASDEQIAQALCVARDIAHANEPPDEADKANDHAADHAAAQSVGEEDNERRVNPPSSPPPFPTPQ
jgi:hypothetical protein